MQSFSASLAFGNHGMVFFTQSFAVKNICVRVSEQASEMQHPLGMN